MISRTPGPKGGLQAHFTGSGKDSVNRARAAWLGGGRRGTHLGVGGGGWPLGSWVATITSVTSHGLAQGCHPQVSLGA